MNDKDILLAALERASAAESMLRRLVDETENDGVIGWEERMTQCIADANKLLAGKFIDGSGACNTCNGHGMVGGHSGQTPEQYEEWQEPCPDCGPTNSATTPQSSAPGVGGERVTPEQWMELGRTQALVEFTAARREERVERLGLSTRPAESVAQGGEEGVGYGIIDPDYARIFTIARVLCWSEGYALTMHGSFTRDLDLVAVPWTDRAREPEHLARRVLEACGLKDSHSNPGEKPHGRLVWTMRLPDFGDPRFVDFSIVPPTPTPTPTQATGSGGEGEDLESSARKLYNASQGYAHNLHTLAWGELDDKRRDEWRKKAKAHPAPAGGDTGDA